MRNALRRGAPPALLARLAVETENNELGYLIPKTRSGWSSGLGREGSTLPVLIAVSRKTWFPQMIGVVVPLPSIATFQRTFFFSLHSRGGVAVRETPFDSGPRH